MNREKIICNLIVAAALTIWSFTGIDEASAGALEPASMLKRYYVHSDNPGLKRQLGVKHEFPGAFSTALTEAQARGLKSAGVPVEPVQLYRLTPKPGGESGGKVCYPDNQVPWGIATDYGNTGVVNGGSGVKVAVLDSGVYIGHPDLARRVAVRAVDCVDATGPKGIKSGSCSDKDGHGTHVAGTILADGGPNGLGIFGVAPGANLMAVKVCGGAYCWGDDIAAGIRYAVANGANIISMSLGGDAPDSQVLSAIDEAVAADVLVVAAAGNDGPDAGSIDYPGAYWKVVAVGAIDFYLNVPEWSSRGVNDGDCAVEEREVEFGSPGVSVESTYKNGCYAYMSGTSMATPHVSGLAAKLWAGSAAGTRTALKAAARDVWVSGDDSATGFGLPTLTTSSPTCP